jgi:hypothetical protein
MRVLFLEFDGCVHPPGLLDRQDACHGDDDGWCRPFGYSVPLDLFSWLPILMEMLEQHPDVFIVVHSNWRETFPAAEIGDMLGDLGNRYLGVAPPGPKWPAITAWLAKNSATTWRILDDAPHEFPDPPPLELIVCHPLEGLSAEYAQAQLGEWLETT